MATTPKTRTEFWLAKIAANKARDVAARDRLVRDGWRVHTTWECQTRKTAGLLDELIAFLDPDGPGSPATPESE